MPRNRFNRRVADLSIRYKILGLATLCCLTVACVCSVGFWFATQATMQRQKQMGIESIAEMVAFNSAAVLSFSQEDAAQELLHSLSSQSTVEYAALFETDGNRLAAYVKTNSTQDVGLLSCQMPRGPVENRVLPGGRVWHTRRVIENQETVGYLTIVVNDSDVRHLLTRNLWISLAVAVNGLVISLFIAARIESLISNPIRKLVAIAKSVTQDHDYSRRLHLSQKDELGALSIGFNEMMASIQQSKTQLRRANETLEERVAERTIDLQTEIETRKETEAELLRAKEHAEEANRATCW
ncbi:MAG: CHASE sensor domain-containing protein, partial [Planctomycetota bacterium]